MSRAIEPFHAIAISRRAHELKAQGRSIIHMEFGQPSTGAPAGAIAAAHHVLDHDPMGYWESQPLKERIALYYAEHHQCAVDPERIFLTNGASPALVLAILTRFEPGARIAFARPGYVAYRNVTRGLYMEPVEIDCGADTHFQLSAAALEALDPAPDGVILSSPANPTGSVIPQAEMEAILRLCVARGITVISDEIYHGLDFRGVGTGMAVGGQYLEGIEDGAARTIEYARLVPSACHLALAVQVEVDREWRVEVARVEHDLVLRLLLRPSRGLVLRRGGRLRRLDRLLLRAAALRTGALQGRFDVLHRVGRHRATRRTRRATKGDEAMSRGRVGGHTGERLGAVRGRSWTMHAREPTRSSSQPAAARRSGRRALGRTQIEGAGRWPVGCSRQRAHATVARTDCTHTHTQRIVSDPSR